MLKVVQIQVCIWLLPVFSVRSKRPGFAGFTSTFPQVHSQGCLKLSSIPERKRHTRSCVFPYQICQRTQKSLVFCWLAIALEMARKQIQNMHTGLQRTKVLGCYKPFWNCCFNGTFVLIIICASFLLLATLFSSSQQGGRVRAER